MLVVMGGRRRSVLGVVLLVVVGALGWWLWNLYGAPNRADLTAYWQLVVAVVAVVVAMITLAKDPSTNRPQGREGASELDLVAARLAEAVETQWTEAAMARRLLHPEPIAVRWAAPASSIAGSAAAATASTRFSPLPGLPATRPEQLRQGALRDLHTVYGGLGSGRLVIAGGPGAGKSAAAVLLVLAALDHRHTVAEADRVNVPVPVLFTLHDWDPSTQPVRAWLISRLRQTYDGLFVGRRGGAIAAELIKNGLIAVILDGLDEIPRQFRSAALQAFSEQAMFRLVVLTRSNEMADAAQRVILDGAVAVELQDVSPTVAAKYLSDIQRDPPPPRWHELVDHLRNAPESSLARALKSPLTLTIVRDTYRSGDSVGELLDFSTTRCVSRQDIEEHLLDRILPQAYAPQPGQPSPHYSLPAARHTLELIAARMNHNLTRDLAWWRIPTWTPRLPRTLAIGLATGLAVYIGLNLLFHIYVRWGWEWPSLLALLAVIGGILGAMLTARTSPDTEPARWRIVFNHPSLVVAIGAVFGFGSIWGASAWVPSFGGKVGENWIMIGFNVAFAVWLVVGFVIWIASKTGHQETYLNWRSVHRSPFMVVAIGFIFGVPGALEANRLFGFLGLEIGIGLVALFIVGLGLWVGLGRLGSSRTAPLNPLASWGQNRAAGLGIWLGLGLIAGGFAPRFALGIWDLLGIDTPGRAVRAIFLGIGLISGFIMGLIFPETWSASLAFTQLAIRRRTPIRLMRFLDDAHKRNVLRTVGPVYQFRHARLQDHLARQGMADTTRTIPRGQTSQGLERPGSEELPSPGH